MNNYYSIYLVVKSSYGDPLAINFFVWVAFGRPRGSCAGLSPATWRSARFFRHATMRGLPSRRSGPSSGLAGGGPFSGLFGWTTLSPHSRHWVHTSLKTGSLSKRPPHLSFNPWGRIFSNHSSTYTPWEQSAGSGIQLPDVVQPGPLRTADFKRPLHRSPQLLSTLDVSNRPWTYVPTLI